MNHRQKFSASLGSRPARRCQETGQACRACRGAGNLTSDGLRLFEFDAQNRHSKTIARDPDEGSKISYLHNALGQRVFKSEPQVAQTAPNATTLGTPFVNWLQSNFGWLFAQAQANATLGQSYVYDDGQLGATPMLLGEYGNGGTQSAGRSEYLWLPLEDGSTMPLGLHTNSRLYAIHADHLNTPRQITDDANATVWQLPYSAFGDNKPTGVLALAGAIRQRGTVPAVTFNLRFPGQYWDEESNLSYNYFRSYQAGQGRYTQNDPIGLSGGLNRFTYVDVNPLSWVDPDGLKPRPSPRTNGGSSRQRRAEDRAEANRVETYFQRKAVQDSWIRGFTRTNEAWNNNADGIGALTGAGGRFNHPSVPNSLEWLISPDRINSGQPYVRALPTPICERESIR